MTGARAINLRAKLGDRARAAGGFYRDIPRKYFFSQSPCLEGKHSAFISHERTGRHS
jgi:hypothetical protein